MISKKFIYLIFMFTILLAGPGAASAWVHWTDYSPGFPVNFGGDSGPAEESSVVVFPIKSGSKWYTQIMSGDAEGYVHRVEVEVGTGTVRYNTLGQWPGPIKAPIATIGIPFQSVFEGQVPVAIGYGGDVNNEVPGGISVRTITPLGASSSAGISPAEDFSWDMNNQDEYGGREGTLKNGVPDGQFGSPLMGPFSPTGDVYSQGFQSAIMAMGTGGLSPGTTIEPADLNNPENYWIGYAGSDHRIYNRRLPFGEEFDGTWPYYTQDSARATPLFWDIDGDGIVEVIASSDLTGGSTLLCDGRPTWDGGRIFALDLTNTDCTIGQKMIWEFQSNQVMYSSPALGDLDGDGRMEVVSGTGPYFVRPSYQVYALDAATGALKWQTSFEKSVREAPALADLDGDGILEVIIACDNGKVYALNGTDGSIRWEVLLRDRDGVSGSEARTGPVVADMDGDGDLEIFVSYLFEVIVIDHNGNQLTGPGDPAGRIFLTYWSLFGSPAVYDIDGDGYMNLVVAGGDSTGHYAVYAWPLTAPATAKAPWPTYRRNYYRHGVYLNDSAYNVSN